MPLLMLILLIPFQCLSKLHVLMGHLATFATDTDGFGPPTYSVAYGLMNNHIFRGPNRISCVQMAISDNTIIACRIYGYEPHFDSISKYVGYKLVLVNGTWPPSRQVVNLQWGTSFTHNYRLIE